MTQLSSFPHWLFLALNEHMLMLYVADHHEIDLCDRNIVE